MEDLKKYFWYTVVSLIILGGLKNCGKTSFSQRVTNSDRYLQEQIEREAYFASPGRNPVYGACYCPYDFTSNYRLCGEMSAYVRPDGEIPTCFNGDSYIQNYRGHYINTYL